MRLLDGLKADFTKGDQGRKSEPLQKEVKLQNFPRNYLKGLYRIVVFSSITVNVTRNSAALLCSLHLINSCQFPLLGQLKCKKSKFPFVFQRQSSFGKPGA